MSQLPIARLQVDNLQGLILEKLDIETDHCPAVCDFALTELKLKNNFAFRFISLMGSSTVAINADTSYQKSAYL